MADDNKNEGSSGFSDIVNAALDQQENVDTAAILNEQIEALTTTLVSLGFSQEESSRAAAVAVQDQLELIPKIWAKLADAEKNVWGWGVISANDKTHPLMAWKDISKPMNAELTRNYASMLAVMSSPLARAVIALKGFQVGWAEAQAQAKPTPAPSTNNSNGPKIII